LSIAGASFGAIRSAAMQFEGESIGSATGAVALPAASFGALKQIDAGVLSVGYAEVGPPDGSPVILLHGWPYDIHTYVDVAPMLAAKGYRVIVPSLRGYGSTRFLSPGAARNGQQTRTPCERPRVLVKPLALVTTSNGTAASLVGSADRGHWLAGIDSALRVYPPEQ